MPVALNVPPGLEGELLAELDAFRQRRLDELARRGAPCAKEVERCRGHGINDLGAPHFLSRCGPSRPSSDEQRGLGRQP